MVRQHYPDFGSTFAAAKLSESHALIVPAETLRQWMINGWPVARYSDRHSVFTVNTEDAKSGEQLTQFGRAVKTLDIESIPANSPQAKGRVERVKQTLQDRFVKGVRLAGISRMTEGNAFLEKDMEIFKHNLPK